jgi:PKD repeat protein
MTNYLQTTVRAVILTLILGAVNSPAATNFVWTGGSDSWQSTTAWDPAGLFPGVNDNAIFTNAATYTVTLNADVTVQSNFFSNASGTLATVTLDLNGNTLNVLYSGTKPGAFNVGDQPGSTSIVYLASSTASGKGLVVPTRIVVGRYGIGTLFVTNGNVSVGVTILGNAEGSGGTLVLSGPNTIYSNTLQCAVGNNSNAIACSLVISNSAVMNVASTFRVGSGASQGGSCSNTLLLDTGARLSTGSDVTIGNNGTLLALAGSYNNSATIQGGAVWNNGNHSFVVGFAAGGGGATGNVLAVGAGGIVSNVALLTITAGNTLDMQGGLLQAGTISCAGTVQGYGTVLTRNTGTTINNGGALRPLNCLGQLTFSNTLTVASGAATTVQLGTNSTATVVLGKLILGGTLNITDGGGFTNGTYTLFTCTGTLTYNGLTIGSTPSSGFSYTIDTSTAGLVKLNVTTFEPPPVASFTASPTNGPTAPLDVTFTDTSTGTITNRFWDFGDGATSNTTETILTHTYASVDSYDVRLAVSGPGGSNTLSRPHYITVGNPPPVIEGGLTVTNAALQVGNVAVVVAGDTNVFSVGATDPAGNPLSYQWYFGDDTTNDWSSSSTVEHAYDTNCGPYAASVTISNGEAAVTSNFTVVVACQLNISKPQLKLNFAKPNADGAKVAGAFVLPAGYSFSNRLATVSIGGAQVSFALNGKGVGVTGYNKFAAPKYNATTGLWTFKATLKNGSWQTPWADYGMTNSTTAKPGALVADLPVILLVDTEAFMGTTNLHYTATLNKSGTAK